MLKNITLSAESVDIDLAREQAKRNGTTLNDTFRKWLREYGRSHTDRETFQASVLEMRNATAAIAVRKYTRDEMNERR
jgi:hypothetical protein